MMKTRGFGEQDEAPVTWRAPSDSDGPRSSSAVDLRAGQEARYDRTGSDTREYDLPQDDLTGQTSWRPENPFGDDSSIGLIGSAPYRGHDPTGNADQSAPSLLSSSSSSRLQDMDGGLGELRDCAGELRNSEPHDVTPMGPGQVQPAFGSSLVPGTPVEIAAQHLLVVDDDDSVRNACCEIARRMGFHVHEADSVPAARAILKRLPVDVLLLDMKLPGGGGLLLLEETKSVHPETAVVVMTAFATVSSAVEAMRIGAADYLTKPFALTELTTMLSRASERRHFDVESRRLGEKLRSQKGDGQLIGNSPEMEKLYRILSKVAFSTHPVLILGESGTGKEMVARSVHCNGPNSRRPFVAVDCSSLVPTLIESELFGHVKGAFTGANRAKEGLLASADGGTVFLDEIGELPLDLQSKLLRALQEKEVRPVGATHTVPISARVLAATNRDMGLMVEQGLFRKDLYFRLNVVKLKVPPLRERGADILMLAQHFVDRKEKDSGRKLVLSDNVLRLFTEYPWPGNVRQLENAIDCACTMSTGPCLQISDLPSPLMEFELQTRQDLLQQRQQISAEAAAHSQQGQLVAGMNDTSLTQIETGPNGGALVVSIAELEKQAILNTIRQLNGDKLMAAKLLQIGKTTLYRKLKEYGIAEGAEEMN